MMRSPVLEALDRHASTSRIEDAVSFWADGAVESLTHHTLAERARAAASVLLSRASPGDRVVLSLPAGLEFVTAFYGCLYAGLIAVPIAGVRGPSGQKLLRGIIQNCRPSVIVSNEPISAAEGLPRISTVELAECNTLSPPIVEGDDIAVLQYTSGSTGLPRGVMVTHDNLAANSRAIREVFRHGSESHAVMWLPHYHDMGLVGGVVHPVVEGFRVTLLCPWKFMQKPVRWLRAVSERRGTTSGGPNFAFAECVRRIRPEDREGLDLSRWDLAFVGAEPIRPRVLETFATTFAAVGFQRSALYPCYGLAEATLIVTGGPKGEFPTVHRVSSDGTSTKTVVDCGAPPSETDVQIVDLETGRPCPPGREGEVWVAGPSVTRGYWELESPTFGRRIPEDSALYLRTGDLGIKVGNNLAVTGRLKDLMIVRGLNLHPQDVEETAARVDACLFGLCSAAFTVDGDGGEEIVLVQEVAESDAAEELRDRLSHGIWREHGVRPREVVFVKPRSLPRTSSGKVRRSECRRSYELQAFRALPTPSAATAENFHGSSRITL